MLWAVQATPGTQMPTFFCTGVQIRSRFSETNVTLLLVFGFAGFFSCSQIKCPALAESAFLVPSTSRLPTPTPHPNAATAHRPSFLQRPDTNPPLYRPQLKYRPQSWGRKCSFSKSMLSADATNKLFMACFVAEILGRGIREESEICPALTNAPNAFVKKTPLNLVLSGAVITVRLQLLLGSASVTSHE